MTTSVRRRVAEAIAIAVVTAVVAMILRGNHYVLRATVILVIFVLNFALDAAKTRRGR